MDFEKRLEKAIQRGRKTGDAKERAESDKTTSEEELKRLHSQLRLELSEYIEKCISSLPNHFPGFQFETVVSSKGWGAAVQRDDIGVGADRKRDNFYSRIEMVIRPRGKYNVLDMAAKGTVRNKEIFNRNHYQRLSEADVDTFKEIIDIWVLEYAESYAT
jgi:hypothetical protein